MSVLVRLLHLRCTSIIQLHTEYTQPENNIEL